MIAKLGFSGIGATSPLPGTGKRRGSNRSGGVLENPHPSVHRKPPLLSSVVSGSESAKS